jgi:hypothetical protein
LPFVQSLGSDALASWYCPSSWTHSTMRLSERDIIIHSEKDRAGHITRGWRQVPYSGNKESASPVVHNHESTGIRLGKRHSKSLDAQDGHTIPPSLLAISRSLIPRLSPRYRHASLNPLQAPSSPYLPTVSPDALVSRQSQSPSQPYVIWADLTNNQFLNTQEFWLTLYFVFNLSLTLYNKGMLVKFPYPYTLTALHALCGAIGGWSLQAQAVFVPKQLKAADYVALMMFSVLYAMNIAVSNASLNLVTVPVGSLACEAC